MDKAVVRESKFRHVYGKCWRKEICLTNVKLQSSANQRNSITSSGKYLAIPWQTAGGSGALAVIPHSQPGPKLPDGFSGVTATGPSPLTDLQFSPFHSDLLATSSREAAVQLWTITDEGGVQATKSGSLDGHGGRINSLSFHPALDNILATSSSDRTIRLWDVSGQAEVLNIDDSQITEVAQDLVWNMDGTLLAASYQKQKVVRVYDVRQNKAVHEISAHDSAKGTFLCFLENDRLISVGSSKGSKREIALWDLQSGEVSEPVAKHVMSGAGANSSASLVPYYDPATGLMYLSGRGDMIFFYEINNDGEQIHPLNMCKTNAYTGACAVPKRVCKVKEMEIERFYLAASDNISAVTMCCPRRNAKTIFQEDLYPPVPSGEAPPTTFSSWMDGEEPEVPYMSMQPEDCTSIYDVSADSGGKSRQAELRKTLSRAASKKMLMTNSVPLLKQPKAVKGVVDMYTGGWWSKWSQRFLDLESDTLYCYESENSPALILSIPVSDMEDISVSEEHGVSSNSLFCIHHVDDCTDETYYFRTASEEKCNDWIVALRSAGLTPTAGLAGRSSGNLRELFRASRSGSVSGASAGSGLKAEKKDEKPAHEGHLLMFATGYVYNSWVQRWFKLQEDVLFVYKTKNTATQHPVEKFRMAKVIAVGKSEESTKDHALKLCTADRVVHLAALDADSQEQWLEALTLAAGLQDTPTIAVEGPGNEGEEECQLVEGMLQKKNTGMMGYARPWTQYFASGGGKELLYFKNKMGTQPLFRISIPLVMDVRECEKYADAFEVVTADREIHIHRTESPEEQQRWIRSLRFLRNQFVNHFEALGLSEEETKAKLKASSLEHFIDPVEVKNGRCPLLVMVKGRRKLTVELVPLSPSSLQETSAYVLDNGGTMYQWNGAKAPRVAKAKAADVLSKIRQKERGGTVQAVVLTQGKNDGTNPKFCALLGGKPPKPTAEAVTEEESLIPRDYAKQEEGSFSIRIYRVLDEEVPLDARLKLIHEGTRQPPRELLSSKCTHVVDCEREIYVWVGKESNAYQRNLALHVAARLQGQEQRGDWASITRVFEEGETILFKEKFSNFPGMLPIQVTRQETKSSVAITREQEPIDTAALFASRPEQETLDEPAAGRVVKVWRIEEFEKEELAEEYHCQLWAGDSFILLYRYPRGNKEMNLVYFWQGRDSSRNEKGTAAYITVDISDEVGDADQVRVEQGKEQAHLRRIAADRLVIHDGKFPARAERAASKRLFRFAGDDRLDCTPTEVPAAPSSLHTLHCFVLLSPDGSAIVWQGKLSSFAEKEAAGAFARKWANDVTVVPDGSAKNAVFWAALGAPASSAYAGKGVKARRFMPRLYLASSATGTVRVEELRPFTQEDTKNNNHALILLTFSKIYVWLTKRTTNMEKKVSMEAAIDFAKVMPNTHLDVFVTEAGKEPLEWTAQFETWKPVAAPADVVETPVMDVLQLYLPKTYPYAELLQDPLPPGVDQTRLETYLSEAEFLEVFGMDLGSFMKLPQWKAEQLKQAAKLF